MLVRGFIIVMFVTSAGFVTVCCSMSVVKAAIFLVKEATMATHTFGLNFTLKL